MPRYVFPDGEIQTLSRRAAADIAVVHPIVEVDATGQPVPALASAIATAIEQLRAHEQVGSLEQQLAEAQARVDEIAAALKIALAQLMVEAAAVTAEAEARAAEEAQRVANEADATSASEPAPAVSRATSAD